MIELDVFMPKIMPYAPGVAEPTAFGAIIKAAQELCERTRLWRDEDVFTITPDSCDVVCVPEGADLFEIEHATINGYALEPISIGDLNRNEPDWQSRASDLGRWITQTMPGSVMVVPRCHGTLRLSTTLRPSNDADRLPDFIGRLHQNIIADGALAEILMTPSQPFTAPDRAQFYMMRFEAGLSRLSNASVKGQQRAKARTRPSYF